MSPPDEPLICATDLEKQYTTADGVLDRLLGRADHVQAVDGVDLTVDEGETLGLVGESGCGKTTLGRLLVGLLEPTAGSVAYRGTKLTTRSKAELRALRTEIQYLFQDPFASLNPRLTVGEIVGEPLEIHDIGSNAQRPDRIAELLETVGLEPRTIDRTPRSFSGGQRQRIAIARALAVEPQFLVCDEPVSALDVSVQAQILNLLADLQDTFDLSYLVISHDLSIIEHIADRVAVMYLGEIVERGPTSAIFDDPSHPYTAALRSAIPEPDPRWEDTRTILEGPIPSPADPPPGCRFHTRCPQVIPPPEYTFSDQEWQALFTLRTRLEDGSLRTICENTVADARPAAVRDACDIPTPLSDPDAEAALSDALEPLTAGSIGETQSKLATLFTTPCETDKPDVHAADHHPIACHRFDPTADW